MKIALLNFSLCLLNILANHILLTRKKSVWFCSAAFLLNSAFVFSMGFIAANYIQNMVFLEYVFTFLGFLYIVYIHLVFSESSPIKIFTMFIVWIFSFLSFFTSVQVSVLFQEIVDEKYMFGFIWLHRFSIQLILMAVTYLWLGKLYKGVISLVPDKLIKFMALYPITAFLLLKSSSFASLDSSSPIFVVPLFIVFIVLGCIVTFIGMAASSKVELQSYMANYDSLTGIANRVNIMNQLSKVIEASSKSKEKFALFVCDLDEFKKINDEYGHLTGDKALKSAAHAVRKVLCNTDAVGRFGGDEFLVIQQLIRDRSDIETLIDRIFEELKKPIMIDGKEIQVNLSIGVSIYPDNASDMELLIDQADSAMYNAKKKEGCAFSFAEI